MEKFNKHADIPYNSKVYINACENTTDLCLVVPELGAIEFPFDYTPGKVDDTVKFIVEACNNYYRLKEQNEKLLNLITQAEAWLSLKEYLKLNIESGNYDTPQTNPTLLHRIALYHIRDKDGR